MAPLKSTKPIEINPWGWTPNVKPEDIQQEQILAAYRITGFQKCTDLSFKRNCKRNPHCLHGLGEKKWKEENEGEDDSEGAAFRCEGEYAGLQNLGATCYVNSLLQLWFHNPIFRPAILRWMPAIDANTVENYKPNCPLAQLQAIFARLKISKRSKIDPTDFVSSLLLNTGEQQDAQEFAKLFMEFIVKLLTDYGDEQIRKLIAQSFNGELNYETECLGCNNRTRRSEGFTELNLNVKKNLDECLDDLLADEIISDEYSCSNCLKKTTAKRRMQLVTLPPILNLQLMRFVFDRETLRRKKVTQNISFPEVLEMQSRVFGINPEDCNASTYKYHLTAVLIHNGQSTSSGHYVAQIKDVRTGEWLKFNDEFVDPVHKGRSQKAKEKENDSDEKDAEKKPKQKKGKNSPSLTSSGAYMLVYISDQYFQQPEPDPELHQYLVNLVKEEDQTFEREVSKNKSEKDFEQSVRNQRRREVEWLYDISKEKETTNGNGNAESDTENEGPKPKLARYDNEVLKESKSVSNSENGKLPTLEASTECNNGDDQQAPTENQNSTNGVGSEIWMPKKKDKYNIDELDFISVDWISQWLDPGNPVPPVENNMLICEHQKLAPPHPTSNPCLYRIVPSPLAAVLYDNYQGGPRLRLKDLCDICVQHQCKRLRSLAQLDEDFKQVTELVKQVDQELANYAKLNQPVPEAVLEGKTWIFKDSLRSWKKLARNKVEVENNNNRNEREGSSSSVEVMDVDNDDGASSKDFNLDLICPHGNLCKDPNLRKIISKKAWEIIEKYFDSPITLDAKEAVECDLCQNAVREETAAMQINKETATFQKTGLIELYSNRNRPTGDKAGTFYIVSKDFVCDWRRFIKEPNRNNAVIEINNQALICEHDKFQYPSSFVKEFLAQSPNDDSEEMACFITPEEWEFIKKNFKWDREIKVTVLATGNKDSVNYDPDICEACAEAWVYDAMKKYYEYSETLISVVKRKAGEVTPTSDEEEELTQKDPIITGKREVKKMDPDAWMHGLSSNTSTVRRSARPRSSKGEKTYKVSSSLTIKELKSKLCPDFKALLSDQHLFYKGKELMDLQKTLGEYRIPARAKLYLEIDTAENGTVDDEPAPRSVETGFQGTLLIGGNAAFGDRSPVQN